MRGRPVTFNDQEVVLKAQKVFFEKGYTATSLPDLLKAMDMGSGSFYNTFRGGKKEVFKKALQQRREALRQFQNEALASGKPLEMIKDFFRSIASADYNTHMNGCIIANSIVEMACLDSELEAEAVRILKEVEQFYTDVIRTEQQKGNLAITVEAAVLGRYLITLWNGLNVTRRMYPENRLLSEQIEMQLDIIS